MNPFAKSLLPSRTAPAFDGPITGISFVRESFFKLSYIPLTKGSSGPTTIMSMLFVTAKSFILSNSLTPIFIFSPTFDVPAFPGAMYSFSTFLLCAIFQAMACSLPPPPNSNIFIFIILDNQKNIDLYVHVDVYFDALSYCVVRRGTQRSQAACQILCIL